MLYRRLLLRRAVASALTVFVLAPILGTLHHHVQDHDDVASHHVEPAHGGHGPVMLELGDRLRAPLPEAPTAAIPATALALHKPLTVQIVSVARSRLSYSGRAPPGSRRSRAPPPP